jgi:hypothetical protein
VRQFGGTNGRHFGESNPIQDRNLSKPEAGNWQEIQQERKAEQRRQPPNNTPTGDGSQHSPSLGGNTATRTGPSQIPRPLELVSTGQTRSLVQK